MISPAIHLPGTCGEAIRFYEKAFGATDIHIDYYRDAPPDPGFTYAESMKNRVMHATMTIAGTPVNLSDTDEPVTAGNMICLNVFLPSADAVSCAYNQLREGGTVVVALGSQFFSALYGSVIDRFGVKWQLIS